MLISRRAASLAAFVLAVVMATGFFYRSVRAANGPAASVSSGPPLVFIHGIKGSLLADADGETHWLTPWQVLGIGTKPLGLPLEWEGEAQKTDALQAAGVLEFVKLIPYLVEKPIYGVWMREARALGRPFYPFAYDWRRDLAENTRKFTEFLTDVQTRHGGQRPQVVAHSMGGLITLAALNERPDLFRSVIFAGVPFGGGIGFLPDLAVGTKTGLNGAILSPEVLGSFPSVYTFFPLDGSGVVDAQGNVLPHDFYSVATWKKNHWGLFRRGEKSSERQEKFLSVALERAKAFRQRLGKLAASYPPIWVVASRVQPTLAEVRQHGKRFDFDSRPKQPGDGRVCEKHALPPEGIPYKTYYSEAEHSALLDDPKVIALVRESINSSAMQ